MKEKAGWVGLDRRLILGNVYTLRFLLLLAGTDLLLRPQLGKPLPLDGCAGLSCLDQAAVWDLMYFFLTKRQKTSKQSVRGRFVALRFFSVVAC